MVERVVFAALYPMKEERAMSGHDLVFYEAAADYVMDDIDRAASKLRERSAEMSDLVEAGVLRLGRRKRSVRSALTIVRRNWLLPWIL